MNPSGMNVALACALALAPATALAAAPAHDHDHGAGAPAPAAASPAVTDTATPASEDRAGQLLRRMRDLHERMAGAKSSADRQKLMAENRQLLQEAMALLDTPSAGPGMDMGKGGGMGMDMMEDEHAGMSPDAAPAGTDPAPGERKRMGGKDMKQCMHMHEAKARHMQLMHAVLQALVDQQVAAAPGG